jgi:hypothetical protein
VAAAAVAAAAAPPAPCSEAVGCSAQPAPAHT